MRRPERRGAGRRRGPAVLAATALLAAIGVGGCTGQDAVSPGRSGSDTRFVAGDGGVSRVRPADRPAAPRLSGETLDGGTLDVAAYRGQVVVLNVWADWCGPCRGEAPALERVWQQSRPQGVQFVGLGVRLTSPDNARAFERTYGITYPTLDDTGGRLLLGFAGAVPPSAIPSTIVLDRHGRIAARIIGPSTYTRLRAVVGEVAGEAT